MEKIVVVGSNKQHINVMCKEIKKCNPDLDVEVLSSLEDLPKREDRKYKGFLIDFRSLMGCSVNHKIMSSLVEELFPVAKYRINKDNSVGLICSSTISNDLMTFLNFQVKSFGARPVRRHDRVEVHIPLKYSTDGGNTWKDGVTKNVAQGGVFLICTDNFTPGVEVLMEFLTTKEVKKGTVRWTAKFPNANPQTAPGSGIEFT